MNQDVHDALCFALWHHQGGSSTIGQPIRKMLDLGPHDHMDEDEIKGAKRVLSLLYPQQRKPLTSEEVKNLVVKHSYDFHTDGWGRQSFLFGRDDLIAFVKDVEAAHGIKE